MHIENLILNVGQFLDEETNVMIGSAEVSVLHSDLLEGPEDLTTMVEFSFNLYNMAQLNNINELVILAEELSEQEAYMISALKQNKEILVNDHLVMTVSDFEWTRQYDTFENKMSVLTKLINYCHYNNYDYLALIVEKDLTKQVKRTNVTAFPKIKQYEALGFERINLHQTPIMVKKLNDH